MARRKEIIATVNTTFEFFSFPKIFKTDFQGNRVPVPMMRIVNDALVPNLQARWNEHVLPRFPRELSGHECVQLERILNAYVCARMACVHPITWDALRSRFQRIADTSGALLKELSDWSATYSIAWKKISRVSELHRDGKLVHDDVYPIISRLHGACLQALKETRQARDAGQRGDHQAPWIALIRSLGELFEQAGGRATAAKNLRGGAPAKPSPFVELIWSVMTEAVPQTLREHSHSKSAMANQISRARALSRHQHDGVIPADLDAE